MALFLVQHGISLGKDVDPERGLSQGGMEESNRIASVAKGYKIPVKKIVCSGKKRAIQTAGIFHGALEAPMEEIVGINPMDDVRRFAAGIDPGENLMVVGHLPFMARLVSLLTSGAEDTGVYRFQNSGIVCLDREGGGDEVADWFIKWTLNPNIS
ncbi:MAG: phosphohistidine phosphatase SixA [Thermodesulfobacteriota bacterium]